MFKLILIISGFTTNSGMAMIETTQFRTLEACQRAGQSSITNLVRPVPEADNFILSWTCVEGFIND